MCFALTLHARKMFQIQKLTSLTGFMFKQKQRANSAHARRAKDSKDRKKIKKKKRNLKEQTNKQKSCDDQAWSQ